MVGGHEGHFASIVLPDNKELLIEDANSEYMDRSFVGSDSDENVQMNLKVQNRPTEEFKPINTEIIASDDDFTMRTIRHEDTLIKESEQQLAYPLLQMHTMKKNRISSP